MAGTAGRAFWSKTSVSCERGDNSENKNFLRGPLSRPWAGLRYFSPQKVVVLRRRNANLRIKPRGREGRCRKRSADISRPKCQNGVSRRRNPYFWAGENLTLFTTFQSPEASNPRACAQKNGGRDLGLGRPEPAKPEPPQKAVFKTRRRVQMREHFSRPKERNCDTVAQK